MQSSTKIRIEATGSRAQLALGRGGGPYGRLPTGGNPLPHPELPVAQDYVFSAIDSAAIRPRIAAIRSEHGDEMLDALADNLAWMLEHSRHRDVRKICRRWLSELQVAKGGQK